MEASERSRKPLVVAPESAEACGPGKGALDDPAPGQSHETALGFLELDHDQAHSLTRGSAAARFLAGVTLIDKGRFHMLPGGGLHFGKEVGHFARVPARWPG